MNKKILFSLMVAVLLAAGGGYYYYSKSGVKADSAGDTNLARGTVVALTNGGNAIKRQIPLTLTFTFSVKTSSRNCHSCWLVGTCCSGSDQYEDQTQTKVVTTDDNGQYRVSASSYRKLTSAQITEVLQSFLIDSTKKDLTTEEKAFVKQLADQLNTVTEEEAKTVVSSGLSASFLGVNAGSLTTVAKTSLVALSDATAAVAVGNTVAVPKNAVLKSITVTANSDSYKSDPLLLSWDSVKYKTDAPLEVALKTEAEKNIDDATSKFVAALNTLDPDIAAKDGYQTLFDAYNKYLKNGAVNGYDNALTSADTQAQLKAFLQTRKDVYSIFTDLTNGGFEQGDTNWIFQPSPSGQMEVVSTANVKCATGDKCLSVVYGGSSWHAVFQPLGILKKGTYRLTAKAKAARGTQKVTINFHNWTTDQHADKTSDIGTEWTTISEDMTVDETNGTNLWRAYLYGDTSRAGSETFFDDVMVEKIK